jgi:hypothetical protein
MKSKQTKAPSPKGKVKGSKLKVQKETLKDLSNRNAGAIKGGVCKPGSWGR